MSTDNSTPIPKTESLVQKDEDGTVKNVKLTVILIYILLVLDIAAYSLIVPLVPYILISFGGGVVENGIAFSGYSLTQYFSSFIFGKLGDRIGRKPCMILVLFGQFVGTIAQMLCTEKWTFVGVRIITGLFDAAYPISQAAIADITRLSERAKYLAQVDGIFSVGYMIGPLLGAFLSIHSYTLSLGCSVGFFFIGFLFSIFGFKETVPIINEINMIKKKIKKIESTNPNSSQIEIEKVRITQIKKVLTSPNIKTKFRFNYFMVLALIEEFCNKWVCTVIDSTFGVYGAEKYGMSDMIFSFVNVGQGFLNAVQQTFLYGFFLNKLQLTMTTLVTVGGCIDIVGVLVCIFAPNLPIAVLGALFLSFGFGFTSPCGSSILSTESTPETQGTALSFVLLGGTLASALGSLILSALYNIFPELPFYASLVPSILIIVLMTIFFCVPGGKYAGMIPHNLLVLSGNTDNEKVIDKKLKVTNNDNNEVELNSINKDDSDDTYNFSINDPTPNHNDTIQIDLADSETIQNFEENTTTDNLNDYAVTSFDIELAYDPHPHISPLSLSNDTHINDLDDNEEDEGI